MSWINQPTKLRSKHPSTLGNSGSDLDPRLQFGLSTFAHCPEGTLISRRNNSSHWFSPNKIFTLVSFSQMLLLTILWSSWDTDCRTLLYVTGHENSEIQLPPKIICLCSVFNVFTWGLLLWDFNYYCLLFIKVFTIFSFVLQHVFTFRIQRQAVLPFCH